MRESLRQHTISTGSSAYVEWDYYQPVCQIVVIEDTAYFEDDEGLLGVFYAGVSTFIRAIPEGSVGTLIGTAAGLKIVPAILVGAAVCGISIILFPGERCPLNPGTGYDEYAITVCGYRKDALSGTTFYYTETLYYTRIPRTLTNNPTLESYYLREHYYYEYTLGG